MDMHPLTPFERKRLAREARNVAYECAEGRVALGAWPSCAVGIALKRAGVTLKRAGVMERVALSAEYPNWMVALEALPRDEATAVANANDGWDAERCEEMDGDPFDADGVVFPLLAFADALEGK